MLFRSSDAFGPVCGGYPALRWQTDVTFLLECTLHGLGFYVGTAGSFIVGPVVATIELILCYQVVLLLKKHRYTRLLLLGEK